MAMLSVIATAILPVLALCALAATADAFPAAVIGGTDGGQLNVSWSLPVSLLTLPTAEGAPVPFLAQDNETIYAANTSGSIMAIRAADGAVLWTYPANATLLIDILTSADHPEYIYFVQAPEEYGRQTLFALRKADGKLTGFVDNLFGCLNCDSSEQFKLVANRYGVVLYHVDGLRMMDPGLTHVLWHKPAGPNWIPFYRHISANDEVVTTVQHWHMDVDVGSYLVSFHAQSGQLLCNISNATDSLTQFPFYVSNDNSVLAEICDWIIRPVYLVEFIEVFDVQSCQHRPTGVFNNFTFIYSDYAQTIWPPAETGTIKGSMQRDNFLLVAGNVTNVTNPSTGKLERQYWTVKGSPVSFQHSDRWQWTADLPNPTNLSLTSMDIGAAHLPHQPEVVVFWTDRVLTAVNGTNGAILWNFTNQGNGIRIGPQDLNANSYYLVYPLSGDRLLVPNLLGYAVASLKDDCIVYTAPMDPLPIVLSFLRADAEKKEPFVVFYSEGSLVAAH